jgi:cytochrome c nitrite reductase small subunit
MKLPLFVGVAALLVVVGTLLVVSRFPAYLSDDPTACNNCHVMDGVYEGWYHAGHRPWATCNDCHTPHSLIAKYLVKAQAGFNHVSAFVLGDIPEAIRPKSSSRQIIQDNCIRCHSQTVDAIADGQPEAGRYCYDCHRNAAHGQWGVSLAPYQDKGVYQ